MHRSPPKNSWRPGLALAALLLPAAAIPAVATGPEPPATELHATAPHASRQAEPAQGHLRAEAAPAGAQGTIRGIATVKVRPPRRTARRYPGAGPAPTRTLQALPAVVYVKGPAGGRTPVDEPTMAQRDTAFHPGVLVVPRGTEIGFPNGDDFFHNVFSYSDAERFDLGRYPRGESKSVEFERPGEVRIYCEVHDFMRAVVVVTESGLHGVVGEDGTFSIEGVPAGTHTVVLWHADLGEAEAEVVVPEGGSVSVELEVG